MSAKFLFRLIFLCDTLNSWIYFKSISRALELLAAYSHDRQPLHPGGCGCLPRSNSPYTQFFKDTRQEMRKVVTPTRNEVQSTTIIVIATVFIFAAYFALVDATLGHGVDQLIVKLTKH